MAAATEYNSQEQAAEAAQEIFVSMADANRYNIDYLDHDKVYAVQVKAPSGEMLVLKEKFHTQEEAALVAKQMPEILGEIATDKDVFIASYQYFPRLRNNEGKVVRAFAQVSEDENEIRNAALKAISKISDTETWKEGELAGIKIGSLIHDQKQLSPSIFLDLQDFKIDVNNTIVDKPELFSYEMLDKKHQFKFRAVNEFENDKAALEDSHLLLQLLLDAGNLTIAEDTESGKYTVQVNDGQTPLAVSSRQYNTIPEAEKAKNTIRKIVEGYRYHLTVDKEPYTYKFGYQLGYGNSRNFKFNSVPKYFGKEEAINAAQVFIDAVDNFQVHWNGGAKELLLTSTANKEQQAVLVNMNVPDEAAFKQLHQAIDEELILQRDIHRLRVANNVKAFMQYTEKDPLSRLGQYVYRLVDKDGKLAKYLPDPPEGSPTNDWYKEVVAKGTAGYQYLQICLPGDNVVQRTDPKSKETGWFYQLKASGQYYTKGEMAGQELVLFESITGHASAEEAAKDFDANYLAVLGFASDKNQYGKGLPISTDPSLQQMGGKSLQHTPLVFVPKATLEELGAYEDKSIEALVTIDEGIPDPQDTLQPRRRLCLE